MNVTGFIITVLLSAFTGWMVVYIALKMLFYPRKPFHFLGLTIQGVFPKNQRLIAEKIGQVVSKELISFNEIEKKVTDPENLQKLRPDIESHIDQFLRNKLKDVFPMLSALMGEKTIFQLKEAFLLELELLFPVLMKSYMIKIQRDLDLEKIITDKVAGFPGERLEEILNQIMKKEFMYLEITGAGFGLLIGLAQLLITFITRS